MALDQYVLNKIVGACPEGILVCDARSQAWPIIYINESLRALMGESALGIVGCKLSVATPFGFFGKTTVVKLIQSALDTGKACQADLEKDTNDGLETQPNTYIHAIPINDEQGRITHVACFYRRLNLNEQISTGLLADKILSSAPVALVKKDHATGLLSKDYFYDQLRRDFAYAQREQRPISIFLFDIPYLLPYKEVFGATGAELTFKRVAGTVAGCFRRTGDLCARWDGSRVLAATLTTKPDKVAEFAAMIQTRVRDLAIHHPRAVGVRFVTLGVNFVSRVPNREETLDSFVAELLGQSEVNSWGDHRKNTF